MTIVLDGGAELLAVSDAGVWFGSAS